MNNGRTKAAIAVDELRIGMKITKSRIKGEKSSADLNDCQVITNLGWMSKNKS